MKNPINCEENMPWTKVWNTLQNHQKFNSQLTIKKYLVQRPYFGFIIFINENDMVRTFRNKRIIRRAWMASQDQPHFFKCPRFII